MAACSRHSPSGGLPPGSAAVSRLGRADLCSFVPRGSCERPRTRPRSACSPYCESSLCHDTRPAEYVKHRRVERWNIVRLAARYEIAVDNYFLIDPFGTGIAEICLQRRPGGDSSPTRGARLAT